MSERVLHFPEQQDLWWLLQALHLTFSNLCSSAKQLKKKIYTKIVILPSSQSCFSLEFTKAL